MVKGVSCVFLLQFSVFSVLQSQMSNRDNTGKRTGSHGWYRRKENHSSESQQTVRLAQLSPEISPIGMWQSRNTTLPTSNLKTFFMSAVKCKPSVFNYLIMLFYGQDSGILLQCKLQRNTLTSIFFQFLFP